MRAFTSRHFGISRQTFYRWWRRYDPQDLSTLEGRLHRPRRLRQATWSRKMAERVLALRCEFLSRGKDKLVVLLQQEGLWVSTSMVGRILGDLRGKGSSGNRCGVAGRGGAGWGSPRCGAKTKRIPGEGARRSGPSRYLGCSSAAGAGVETLYGPGCGFSLGCAAGAHASHRRDSHPVSR